MKRNAYIDPSTVGQDETCHCLLRLSVSGSTLCPTPADEPVSVGKRRCRPNKASSAAPCARCEKMQIPCSLSSTGRPPASPEEGQKPSPSYHQHYSVSDGGVSGPDDLSSNASYTSRSTRLDLLQLDPSWRQEMVNHYFDVVHDKHHSLFHRPTFENDLHNNHVPDVILCAVLSLGSR